MIEPTDSAAERLPDRRYVPWYRRWVPSWRTVAIGLLVLCAVPFCIRWYRLSLLPDVSLPFDVEAFSPADLPAEENAFYYFKQLSPAVEPTSPWYQDFRYDPDRPIAWPDVPANVQTWVQQSQRAIELVRAGGRCAEGYSVPIQQYSYSNFAFMPTELRSVYRSIPFDVLRRLDEGDTQGTIEELQDAFRASRHLGRRGSLIERLVGSALSGVLYSPWRHWSRDPRVTAEELEAALARRKADWELTPQPSDWLKVEVMMLIQEARSPRGAFHDAVDENLDGLWRKHLGVPVSPFSTVSTTFPGWQTPLLWVLAEPELSARAAKLWLTHQLKYCDLPPHQRPHLLPGPNGLYQSSERLAGQDVATINRRIQQTYFAEFFSSLAHNMGWQQLEVAHETLLEIELQWQIRFRRGAFSLPIDSSAEFDWPADPCGNPGDRILYRAEKDRLVIWSRGHNGKDDDGKAEQRPLEDDIVITIPWPTEKSGVNDDR